MAVLMFWSELKQFACIQSQCHRKLGEQQLNSIGLCRATLIHIAGIVCRFIHSAANTIRSTDAGLMLAQRLRRYTNINQALVQITAVFVACLVVISCLLYIYMPIWVTSHSFWLTCNFYLNARNRSDLFAASLVSIIQRLSHWRDLLF